MKVRRKIQITLTERNIKDMIVDLLGNEYDIQLRLLIPDPRSEEQGFSILAEYYDEDCL